MDYVLIELMLRDQETADPNWQPFILFNTVVKFGKETELQEIKNELRKYYLELKEYYLSRKFSVK